MVRTSILIIGGTGLLGSHIARQLVARGDKVVIFDSAPSMEAICDIANKVKVVAGSIMELGTLLQIIKQEQVYSIVHTAAVLNAEVMWKAALEVNVEGTINVCEAARIMDVDRVIYTSTRAIYGQSSGNSPIKEEYQGRPERIYDITKLAGELFGHCWAKKYGIDFKALRVGGLMYGIGMKASDTILGTFKEIVEQTTVGKPVKLELGEVIQMDMVYVKDVARAHLLALDVRLPHLVGSAFNVGTGQVYTFQDLVDVVKKLIPESEIKIVSKTGAKIRQGLPLDVSRIHKELRFQPMYDLEKGVRDYIQDIRRQLKQHMNN